MTEHDDALWDPSRKGDPELQRMEALLAPYSVNARGVGEWTRTRSSPVHRYRWVARVFAIGMAASVLLYAGLAYRLAWNDGQPWRVAGQDSRGVTVTSTMSPGSLLETDQQESLAITVARIGRITVSPESKLRLIETRAGKHRVNLESGHIRARIWAPPGYFGVVDGAAEVIDLGCDFDLWKQTDGSGRLYVRSGWVDYHVGSYQVLVPAGFALRFDAHRPFTPIRPGANLAFVKAVQRLEQSLAESGPSSVATKAASEIVARTTRDADAFTLLSLLSQYPELAGGALYSRLALALKTPGDDASHRAAWTVGNQQAIDAWWQKFPTQPKRWWVNWSDAFPL